MLVDPITNEQIPDDAPQSVKDNAIAKARVPVVFDVDSNNMGSVITGLQDINKDKVYGRQRLQNLPAIDGVTNYADENFDDGRFNDPKYNKTLQRTGNCYYANTQSGIQIAGELIKEKEAPRFDQALRKQYPGPFNRGKRKTESAKFVAQADQMLRNTLKGDVQRGPALTQYIDKRISEAPADRPYDPYTDQRLLGNPNDQGVFDKPEQIKRQNFISDMARTNANWNFPAPQTPVSAPNGWRPIGTTDGDANVNVADNVSSQAGGNTFNALLDNTSVDTSNTLAVEDLEDGGYLEGEKVNGQWHGPVDVHDESGFIVGEITYENGVETSRVDLGYENIGADGTPIYDKSTIYEGGVPVSETRYETDVSDPANPRSIERNYTYEGGEPVLANEQISTLDTQGNVRSVATRDAQGNPTERKTYDAHGNLLTHVDAQGNNLLSFPSRLISLEDGTSLTLPLDSESAQPYKHYHVDSDGITWGSNSDEAFSPQSGWTSFGDVETGMTPRSRTTIESGKVARQEFNGPYGQPLYDIVWSDYTNNVPPPWTVTQKRLAARYDYPSDATTRAGLQPTLVTERHYGAADDDWYFMEKHHDSDGGWDATYHINHPTRDRMEFTYRADGTRARKAYRNTETGWGKEWIIGGDGKTVAATNFYTDNKLTKTTTNATITEFEYYSGSGDLKTKTITAKNGNSYSWHNHPVEHGKKFQGRHDKTIIQYAPGGDVPGMGGPVVTSKTSIYGTRVNAYEPRLAPLEFHYLPKPGTNDLYIHQAVLKNINGTVRDTSNYDPSGTEKPARFRAVETGTFENGRAVVKRVTKHKAAKLAYGRCAMQPEGS